MKDGAGRLSLEEIQKLEYQILCSMADICEKHNIRYGLCGGTLLGAVRHGGFIPWDDDIDIEMPRPDYNKFIEIAKQELPEYYKLSTPYNDNETFHCYGKIYDMRTKLIEFPEGKRIPVHVYIDIFPIDGMPDQPVKREQHRLRARKRMLAMYGFKVAKYKLNEPLGFLAKLFWNVIAAIERVIPNGCLIHFVDALTHKYDFDKSEYNSEIIAGYGFRETMPHIVYDYSGKIQFIDRVFSTFLKPEYYLINIYGDYMKIPPEEERVCHNIEAYWIGWQEGEKNA